MFLHNIIILIRNILQIIRIFSVFTPQQKIENFKDVYLVTELMNYNLHEASI